MFNENQNSSDVGLNDRAAKGNSPLPTPDDANSLVEAGIKMSTCLNEGASASEPNSRGVDLAKDSETDNAVLSTPIETLSSGEDPASSAHLVNMDVSSPDERIPESLQFRAENDYVYPSTADDPTISQIRYWHRQRKFGMDQRKRADLALGAFLRTMLGWRKDLPKDESDRIKAAAAALLKKPEGEWTAVIEAAQKSREPFETVEDVAKKQMEKLAKSLPIWKEFGEPIKGFGAVTFAIILAEAGDLSNYPTKSHLWKRMGLAVLDGNRQGSPGKGASADDWIRHGYNPSRRSQMFVMGDSMLKKQIGKVKDESGEDTGERIPLGYYGEVYLARKEYELQRNPEMKPIQAHRRAQRYMEKRLLKNLWQAWRRDRRVIAEGPMDFCPDVQLLQAAE